MPDLFADVENWVEVDKENYEHEVIGADKPVMLEFWGKKCKKCEDATPMIQRLAEKYLNKLKFCHWECPCLYAVKKLGVRNLPTLYFYANGERVAKLSEKEQINEEAVKKELNSLLKQYS